MEEKSNLVSECYVVYVIDGPHTRILPTIHLSKPIIAPNERWEQHSNVFEAKNAIRAWVGNDLTIRVAA